MKKFSFDQYNFLDLIDEEIIEIAHRRKYTLQQDLRRHIYLIIRIYLGISKYSSKKDLPYLFEWVMRLQNIINQQKNTAHDKRIRTQKG